ncbi:lysophospholipid acyltransferase family protein [Domibacillus enclensis]|uniref:1-acyl-sn-glycerol-3-phosphate acyltransferases n=1 Tax=Domibacillus enclensis TaxID=1017273 RepID=A0A1N6NZJ9_9BACI|nr:lysophospholipid acyltransferase family protein [Domibacillus enclensis]OXS80193.1 hypothetical protein B1B05_01565 [Domibacillus enclensis]SIP97534.1 1-acyl-sn-glycerol-3-phosphate acyltransferases [Domibacillus enclensis]
MFNGLFKRYIQFLLKKEFANVYIRSSKTAEGPKLYVPNHSSWWDALVIYYVNAAFLREDARGMMAEEGLKRFPFFKKIGAFPVGQSPKQQLAAIQTAARFLQENRSVWLFAQGEERFHTVRPLQFKTGAGFLKERVPSATLLPVAITYAFRHERKPDIFVWIGEPVHAEGDRKTVTRTLEEKVEEMLDDVTHQLEQETTAGFEPLLQGKKTIDQRVERRQP